MTILTLNALKEMLTAELISTDMWYVDCRLSNGSQSLLAKLSSLDIKQNFTNQTGVDCFWRENDGPKWNNGRILGLHDGILTFRMMATAG